MHQRVNRSASGEGQAASQAAAIRQDGAKDREDGRQRRVAKVQGVRDQSGSWLQRTRSKEAREKRSYSSGAMPTLMSLKSLL